MANCVSVIIEGSLLNYKQIMDSSQYKFQRWMPAGFIGLVATVLVAILWVSGLAGMETWELRTYDLRMQWRGAGSSTNQLVVIGRDEKSEARFGIGIWDRAIFAKMIAALHRAGASVIALDFHFGGMSPAERGGKVSDKALVNAAASAGTVVLPVRVSLDHDPEDTATILPQLKLKLLAAGPSVDPVFLQQLPQAGAISALFPDLMDAAHGLGHIAASSDLDGVYRRVPMIVNGGGTAIPALGLTLAATYLKVDSSAIELIPGETLQLKGATLPDGTRRDLLLPVDPQGNIFLDYVGRWADNPFQGRHFSFVDVWDSIDGKGNEEELRKHMDGKAVLILHAALESDKRRTPLELTAPGGFILANTFNTIVTEGRLHVLQNWQQWGLVVVAATTAAGLMLMLPLRMGIVGVAGLWLLYVASGYWGLAWFGVVLPMLLPLAGLVLATGGALAWTSWLSLGQVHVFKGQIQVAESTRLALQEELNGLQELIEEQEAHVQRLEDESTHAQRVRLALQQEITGLQELRMEKETHVLRLERELATLHVNASAEQLHSLQVRATLEAELRRTIDEKAQLEHHSLQLRGRLDHELDARTNRETELRRVKEDLERAKQTLATLPTNNTGLWVTELEHDSLTSEEVQDLQKECERCGIITSDTAVLKLFKRLRKAARFNKPIMILGESGTGKELFAQAVHKLSGRAGNAESVNCAGVPETLVESELFGYRKGAHSTATSDYKGAFLRADNRTIFLDEIGELKLEAQAKLLRVLQESKVMRLGDSTPMPVNVRVVVATNRDLGRDVAEGRFREDLYHRLNVITLRLPPLRERPDDIPKLAKYFVDQMVREENLQAIELSQGAIDRLKAWSWRGNIRELKNVLEKAIVFADSSVITEHDLDLRDAVITAPNAAVSSVVFPPSEDNISSNDTGGVETIVPAVSELPPWILSDGGDDPRTNDWIFLLRLRECHFDVNKTATKLKEDVPTLKWDRSTVMHRLKGLCFQALVYTDRNVEAAAYSLAGGDLVLKKLAAEKVQEYLANLDETIERFASREEAVIGCQDHFKNLPKRYHKALVSLVRTYSSKSQSISIS